MIADISIREKSFGSKLLYDDLRLSLQAGEKVGLIGRNGAGKSTLLGLMDGSDTDYTGEIIYKKGLVVAATRQEHHGFEAVSVCEYILGGLPEYAHLRHIIDTYPATMGDNPRRLGEYSEALERFAGLGYYTIEDKLVIQLGRFQIPAELAAGPFGALSGGQKRLAEVVKIMHSQAGLALIDEPTNHMDYVAKGLFIDWLRSASEAMLIVTHDRDVLGTLDRIVEIKDSRAVSYAGNYDHYLKANLHATTTDLHGYEVTQRRVANLRTKVTQFRRLKERARDPDTIKQFKRRELQAAEQLAQLEQQAKPTFWIDRDSVAQMNYRLEGSYRKHKAKTIQLGVASAESRSSRLLVEVRDVSVGYGAPLFGGLSSQLREGERIELRGRNGAGKTTLISALLAVAAGEKPATLLHGQLSVEPGLNIGVYRQEVAADYFHLPLAAAIEQMYMDSGLPITQQKIMQLMSNYLFDPVLDARVPLAQLSGGQKARFQLISMLVAEPRLLLLDEPTNHLDLPSIEELETALGRYYGAIIYVSHDDYFRRKLPAEVVTIGES